MVSLDFWTDSKVDDEFTPEDKYFMLYLLTNPHTRLCGCYEISFKQMERETGYNVDSVKRSLERLENIHKVISYDYETKEVLIYNWGKYNWGASEKVKSGILNDCSNIKNINYKQYIEALLKRTKNGENHTIKVNPIPKREAKAFIKPKIEEIEEYCKNRNNNVNPEHFYDFYESKGWYVGKNIMKDWKACVRTWEKNNKKSNIVISTPKYEQNKEVEEKYKNKSKEEIADEFKKMLEKDKQ